MVNHQIQEYHNNPYSHEYNNNHHKDMQILKDEIKKIFKQINPNIDMKTLSNVEKIDFIKMFLLEYEIEDFTKTEIATCLFYTLEAKFTKKDSEGMFCKK